MKIRGFRIELGEIETALSRHPAVGQAVILAREDRPGEKQLVGYVVAKTGEKIEASALREHLARSLPEYMVPAAMVFLETLPLTPNGKLNRKALPQPEGRQTEQVYVAPQNELERLIAGVWQELLKLKEVGIHDNFFDLGGHSLLLIRAQSGLQELLKRKITVVELFQFPTIHRLAQYLSNNEPSFLPDARTRAHRQKQIRMKHRLGRSLNKNRTTKNHGN